MEEQRSSQAERTQQLFDESKQHSEQLTKLAGENQARWKSLTVKQPETSEAVSPLVENLGSVKAVMHNHIYKDEEELGQLRSWQEQLARKQGEFQARIQEEFARLKLTMDRSMTSPGKPESKSLRITAPIFVPTAGTPSVAPSSEGASYRGSKMMQRPAPFDESSAWEAYQTQFGLLAGLNK